MRTELEDCCQLRQPESRQWHEPNEARTQKIQEEPAAAYVTPGMRGNNISITTTFNNFIDGIFLSA